MSTSPTIVSPVESITPTDRRPGDSPPTRGSRKTKRAQVSRACARCRRLQKGCSESRPCQRCIKTGLAEQCLAGGVTPPSAGAPQTHYGSGAVVYELTATPALVSSPSLSGMSFAAAADTNFSRESFQRQADVLPSRVIEHCAERFFARLSPTIPIVSREYVATLRQRAAEPTELAAEAYCVLLGMCSMVLLQAEDPEARQFPDILAAETNAAYAWILLEEALAAHRHLPRRPSPSYESVLLTFFIYACHAALLHHSQAFYFLRETTTLYLLLNPEALPDTTRVLAERLYWILIASERGHAIRYRRPITLQITAASPVPPVLSLTTSEGQSLAGFGSLAALFRPMDTSFIAILNHENVSCPPSVTALDEIETNINSALNHSPPVMLHETQKANLRVTQLWLRIIVWQVRLRLGLLSEVAVVKTSHTYHYPLEVAKDLALSTRDLELGALTVHGAGLTEKLFDIACVVVNVLARVPLGFERGPAEEDVRYLRGLIRELPGGKKVYEKLMVKHLMAVLPAIVGN